MKRISVVSLSVFLLMISQIACTKDHSDPLPAMPTIPPSNPVPDSDPVDTATVKLTNMEMTGLPSPYYQFAYNDSGYAITDN